MSECENGLAHTRMRASVISLASRPQRWSSARSGIQPYRSEKGLEL